MERAIRRKYHFDRPYIKRTNKPGTCLWCGNELRKARYSDSGDRGDYADNAFCGLRCGYCFGVSMAAAGKRLVLYDGKD